ncbi:phosphatidylglycerophosphatase A [candidate division FCPU426 bacterium]|nr:phosphatidylglycerophosphatase A [candidate division FCPU426 bacterium]
MKRMFALASASVLGVGYFPWASGTLATGWALLPYFACRDNALVYILVILGGGVLGVWSAGEAERILREKDSHRIVIDEVIGYLLAMAFLPAHWFYPLAGFFLFRLFDIWKPLWIRKSQELPGGWGVMLDDVLAGVCTNILLRICMWLGWFAG